MASIALALDRETEDRLIGALLDAGHDVIARISLDDDVAEITEAVRPDVLLVLAAPAVLTSEVLSVCDERGIRVVALTDGEPSRRLAARLGLFESADSGASIDDIEALIDGRGLRRSEVAPRSSGDVVAVWGPAGAPGRTTVATSLAIELAAAGRTVALLDADTWSASIAPVLGMLDESPGFAAACRLAGQASLTIDELDRIAQRYPVPGGTLNVLTGLTRASRWPELSTERVAKTISVCKTWADHVIIDTGFSLDSDEEISSDMFSPRRNAATLAAIRASDRIVAVGSADPIGLARYLRMHPDLVDVAEGLPVTPVINRVRASAIGLNPSGQIKSTLLRFGGIGEPVLIPHDEKAADAAVLAGRAIRDVAPRSAIVQNIRRLAAELLPSDTALATRRSMRRQARAAMAN